MAIDVYHDEISANTVICEFDAHWTWDEMARAVRQVNNLLAEAKCGHVILLVPSNTLWGRDDIARNLGHNIQELRKTVNLVVIVGASTLTRLMLDTLSKVGVAKDFRYAQSLDDARVLVTGHCEHG